uniref:Mitochondrial dicarboxylate carrier-like n=1 Tax=Diabrotica virgifera virgifera TaxID=50390 RepID=A0A6P7GX85_DIAVI
MEISQKEGFVQIFRGSTMAYMRSVLLSVGQLSIYDKLKIISLRTGLANDNIFTHLNCSIIAVIAASLLSQPFDMIKIKLMNADPGEYKGVWDCIRHTQYFTQMHIYPMTCNPVPWSVTIPLFYNVIYMDVTLFKIPW